MEYKDYYKILGVPKTATEKDLRTAYRKLAKQYHPDRNPNNKQAEARFKEINEANDVLSDPEKRRKYDRLGANWKQYEQYQRSGGTGPQTDIGDLFRGTRGGATGQTRTVTPEELEEIFGNLGGTGAGGGGGGFSDFFQTFFGGSGRGSTAGTRPRSTNPRRGLDVDQPVEISVEEAINGATRVVQLTDDRTGQARRIEVKIPPGVTDGSRVRISGQGAPGTVGGKPGDLFLVVRLAPSPIFAREGDDLRAKVPVRLTTAVLGGEIEVPSPRGGKLALKIPPQTQDGRVFRLRGQGLPRLNGSGERGDLFAEVHVQLPESLSPRQRQLFEELAGLEMTGAAGS